jgi:hypothetical protein
MQSDGCCSDRSLGSSVFGVLLFWLPCSVAPCGNPQSNASAFATTPLSRDAFEFFSDNLCRLEVAVENGSLQRLYFPKPIICTYLTDITREKVHAMGFRGRACDAGADGDCFGNGADQYVCG